MCILSTQTYRVMKLRSRKARVCCMSSGSALSTSISF
jgi:hypothetical protein